MKKLFGVSVVLAMMLAASGAWAVVDVLASFDDDAGMDYYTIDTATAEIVTGGTPGPSSTKCLRVTCAAADFHFWDDDGEYWQFVTGLDFDPPKDLTQYGFLNYYIKGTSTAPLTQRWNSATNLTASTGSGINQDPPVLPADWTYVSVPIGDFQPWWKAIDMAAVPRLEFGFTHRTAGATMTVYIDHVTLTTTTEEGEIASGPAPADCEDPFLAQSGLAVSGEPFSIMVAGVDASCVDSVSWEKDGVPIEQAESGCVTITTDAGVGDTVTVDYYDSWGNKIDLSRDVDYADVGFAKTYPRSLRFDYMTLSDTPEAGMLGAVGGNVYVVSAMEEGDIPSSLSGGGLITTDSAGAGSTACVEVPVMWGSWIWAEYYGANVDVSCCAQYLNFYVKVADGADWAGNASAGIGGNDNWDSGFWQDDAFTYPGSGQGWKYVSIAIGGESVWGDPDWTTVAAVGIEFSDWNAQGDFYSFSTPDNPEVFESGSAVFTLTQEMLDATYFWAYVNTIWGDETYVELAPPADALSSGGSCSGILKAITGITVGGMRLVLDPVREQDA
ncbi:MAG: hypothetical protein NTZ09_07315, partial [Candidatus Hydrogenedentes bacterium]|nr:hypothetical protein [Candidatus Hydrogenedentota bacterium]